MRGNWRRLNGPDRIAGVDLARGLAVIGMFAAHLLLTADSFVWTEPSTWTAVVDGRSSILFATLAGVSIGLVTGGRSPLAGSRMAVARFKLVLRALMLLVLGILLIVTGVPVFVILPAYAILFLLALPFTRLRAVTVLWTAAGLAVVMPFVQPALEALPIWEAPLRDELDAMIGWHYPFTVWIAFVLAGLGIARAGVALLSVQLRMLVSVWCSPSAATHSPNCHRRRTTRTGPRCGRLTPTPQACWKSSAPVASRSQCLPPACCCAAPVRCVC